MDEIIKKIIDAEHTAKAIVKKAEDERDNLDSEIEKSVSEIRNRYFEKAKKELSKISEKENEAAKSQIIKLEKDFREQMSTMCTAADKYQAEWVKTFFASVVGEEYATKQRKNNKES